MTFRNFILFDWRFLGFILIITAQIKLRAFSALYNMSVMLHGHRQSIIKVAIGSYKA